MAQVKFISCTAAQFAGLDNKDAATLYFISDSRTIYKGDVPFSGGIYKKVSAFPETDTAEVNVLYIHETTGEVRFFDGAAYQTVVLPKATTISGSSTHGEFATAKSVADYVTETVKNLNTGALADRVTAVEGKTAANESAIGVINGTGDGSIKKAASDAQAAAEKTAAADATAKANAAETNAKSYADTKKTEAVAAAKTETTNQVSAAKTALEGEIAKKADKATTLAGYGIGDAYTKTQTDSAIATAVANAHHLKREIVKALPAVEAANEDTIYMVPDGGDATVAGSAKSIYTEYMLINGAFERIGTSDTDLSNYYTKGQVDTAVSDAKTAAANDATSKANAAKEAAIAAAATDASTKANAAQAAAEATAATKASDAEKAAKDYADGLAKNYATAAQGAKADSALQAADVIEGTTNGAISVKGTAVKVHGLGSAAYAGTGDFATAAQGAKADSAVQKSDVVSGSANGTISVQGKNVAVKGLGSAAYVATSAFDAAGSANAALSSAKSYADTKKTEAVSAAAADATTKANNALASAKEYTDSALTWGTL